MPRKRPCSICRRWFRPDARVGDRQRACGEASCQAARRRRTQAGWRAANAGYGAARRIQKRAAVAAESGRNPAPLRVPSPLDRLPWDLAQDEMGGQAADFIGLVAKVLRVAAKDQRHAQLPETIGKSGGVPPVVLKDQSGAVRASASP